MVILTARVKIEDYLRQKDVKRRFWRDKAFKQVDSTLLKLYRFKNPYAISRRFTGEHVYGETPLQTFEAIALKARLGPEDHLFELGAGRCRGAFFLSHFFKCQVTAFEQIPLFASLAQEVILRCHVERVHILESDFFKADLSEATCVYLYGTSMSDGEVDRICEKLATVKRSVKIISVSFPLPGFNVEESFSAHFPWGETDIYIQRR